MKNIDYAIALMRLYAEEGHSLYLVGGSVRDYLLYEDFKDFDFASPCLVEESAALLYVDKYDEFSAKFGTLKTIYQTQEIEITTFRKEGRYSDYRHPDSIVFVDNLYIDAQRRDFTINSMYMNSNEEIIDPYNGRKDLENKLIRMVGNPFERIKQDPVRILRALRFVLRFDFYLENSLATSIRENAALISHISEARGVLELKKMLAHSSKEEVQKKLDEYDIDIQIADYLA